MPARLAVSWRATNTPSEPHRMTSISGQKPTSNQRWGERHRTSQWRRTTTAMRCALMTSPSPRSSASDTVCPATSRNAPSRSSVPNCWAISVGVPSAAIRPRARMTTRSQRISTSRMLWLVTSSAVPSSRCTSSRAARTRSATSGSSEAVGSSSTSRRGRWSTAFTMPTSVRCPDDSSWPRRSTRRPRPKRSTRGAHDGTGAADAVEAGEDLERLEHRQVLGQRQVAGDEADLPRGPSSDGGAARGRPASPSPHRAGSRRGASAASSSCPRRWARAARPGRRPGRAGPARRPRSRT